MIRNLIVGLLLVPAVTLTSASLADPVSRDSQIYEVVERLDAILFDAFNDCALDVLSELVDEDLEFYHDRTGLDRGRDAFLTGLRENACGKVRRELIPGTLAVYPLAGYGTVEMGSHRFCDARRYVTCEPQSSGDADFIMLWQESEMGWRLSRVISYDHIDRPD